MFAQVPGAGNVGNEVYAGKTIKEWIADLKADGKQTKHKAMDMLESMGRDAEDAVPPLAALVLDEKESEDVRAHAVVVLGHIGTSSKVVRTKIIAVLNGSVNSMLRAALVHTLGHWHEVGELITRLDQQKEPHAEARREAAEVLGKF
ncbi:MAG: hypothetical protein L0215_04680 [Gemmataceae bacterium]|nr:hypothetical protein [Gemmataceae bacterium]